MPGLEKALKALGEEFDRVGEQWLGEINPAHVTAVKVRAALHPPMPEDLTTDQRISWEVARIAAARRLMQPFRPH